MNEKMYRHMFMPNMNGNTKEDLDRQFERIEYSARELIENIKKLDATHGRNYQTLPRPDIARRLDEDERVRMLKMVEEIELWATSGRGRALYGADEPLPKWRQVFPDFDGEVLELPDGFRDESDLGEGAPFFVHDASRTVVFFDYVDPAKKREKDRGRFIAQRYTYGNTVEEENFLHTDDKKKFLRFVRKMVKQGLERRREENVE